MSTGHHGFELCSAPCKALRFTSTPLTRGLRALTAPARSSSIGSYVMAGNVTPLKFSNLGFSNLGIDVKSARRYSANISPVLSEHPLRFAVTACGARFHLTASGHRSNAPKNNKFRGVAHRACALTSHTELRRRQPSALSNARLQDRRWPTAVFSASGLRFAACRTLLVGRRRSLRSLPTPRGAMLRGVRCRHHARIRALRTARRPQVGALVRATPTIQCHARCEMRARAEGP